MKQRKEDRYLQLFVLCLSCTAAVALYFTADYYLDPGMSKIFGGYCGERIEDACFYLSSHFKFFGLGKYGNNKDCTITIDAGSMGGALYKLELLEMDLPSDCSDYLEVYEADFNAISSSNKVGRFCGNTLNTTGWPTQRYLTFVFHTDGSGEYSGLKIRATRYEPTPCQDDEFECAAEGICIDSRLKCDGTQQCTDASDETGCTALEKFIGGFLALGMAGMATVGFSVIAGCIGIWVVVGAFTCCKKCCAKLCSCCPCGCCKKCCKVPGQNNGPGSAKSSRVRPVTSDLELAEVDENDDNLPPKPDTANSNFDYTVPQVVENDNAGFDNGKTTKMTGIGTEPTNYDFI